jgi:hypothetical protein
VKLRLKHIVQDVDFRHTELDTYEQFRRSKSFTGDPKPGEAILFVSRSGNQLCWIMHYETGVLVQKTYRARIQTLRMRVSGGYWNPLMLANYAKQVGIELIGIKLFEETYRRQREARKMADQEHGQRGLAA